MSFLNIYIYIYIYIYIIYKDCFVEIVRENVIEPNDTLRVDILIRPVFQM